MKGGFNTRDVPRWRDEEVLQILAMRKDGFTCKAIAARFGSSPVYITNLTNAIRHEDLAESGEPAGLVKSRYW